MPPYVEFGRWPPSGMLICDDCESMLMPDGSKKPLAAVSDAEMADTPRDSLHARARESGWGGEGERWSCSECRASKPPRSGR